MHTWNVFKHWVNVPISTARERSLLGWGRIYIYLIDEALIYGFTAWLRSLNWIAPGLSALLLLADWKFCQAATGLLAATFMLVDTLSAAAAKRGATRQLTAQAFPRLVWVE
jgi:hypothetical protein